MISCNTRSKITDNTITVNKEQDSLALELCQIFGFDQGIRTSGLYGSSIGTKKSMEMDSLNFIKIIDFIKQHGAPNKKNLGESYRGTCVQAAVGAVLLHNPQRIVKDKDSFYLLLNEVNKGNLKREGFAFVLDKYYVFQFLKKGIEKRGIYGTQWGKPCLEDRKISDSLRSEIGLPSLKDEDFNQCNKE
jgi:hypothetical protein